MRPQRPSDLQTISVVIALFNGAGTVCDQLSALANQTRTDFEVIIADNGSTDNGPQIAREHPLKLRVIDASPQSGQGYARNEGAKSASGDLLLFCDQDDVVAPTWVAAMADALGRFHVVGGRGDSLLNEGIEGWRDPPAMPTTGEPLPFASGSNLGIRRTVFEAIGGWPTCFRGGGEDMALCWKAQMEGFDLGFAPDALIHYRFRTTLRAHIRQQYGYGRAEALVRAAFSELPHPLPPTWPRVILWLVLNGRQLCTHRTAGRWLGALARRCGTSVGMHQALKGHRAFTL